MDSQVFGRIAGEAAAERAKSVKAKPVASEDIQAEEKYLEELQKNRRGLLVSEIWRHVRRLSYRYASMIRTQEGLNQGLIELKSLQEQPVQLDRRGLPGYFELRSVLLVAEMIFRSARLRKESRGPHLFFKEENDPWPQPSGGKEWERYAVLWKEGEEMQIRLEEPVPLTF